MAKVTPGFKLYLYRLLSTQLGIGKQTLLLQVEEVLAADDIIPEDLECTSIQEVVEACPDFLKLTIFKKGRAYATVLAREDWDQMLTAPQEKQAAPAKKATGGPKTWKKKKSSKQTLKPVKPGKQRRNREAAERRAQEEAERRKQEEARLASEAAEAAQLEGSDEDSPESVSPTPTAEAIAREGATSLQSDALSAGSDAPKASPTGLAVDETANPNTPIEQTGDAKAEKHADHMPSVPEADTPDRDADAPSTGPADSLPANSSPALSPAATVVEGTVDEHEGSTSEQVSLAMSSTAATSQPLAESLPQAPQAPRAEDPAPISLTITYNPYEDMERELERQRAEEEARAAQEPRAIADAPLHESPSSHAAQARSHTDASRAQATPLPMADLPQDVASEVACKDALLRMLYQLLPYDVDPMAVLDEDWRVARSTGTLSGSRNRVAFPLRYLHEDGTPISVTFRKTTRNASGKRWSLALVDGDDGSGSSHASVGFDGLPTADEGAWSDLAGNTSPLVSPVRELAQHVVIGTWERLLGSLATMAAPERWNYPGEGVGKPSRYGILREYLALTFHRARMQERIATSSDGSFATFCTGLANTFGQDIYACLTARKGDIPWQFAGFATMGSGELGSRLAGTISDLPLPPSYLHRVEDVLAQPARLVILDGAAILGKQLGRLPRAFLAEHMASSPEASALLSSHKTLSADELQTLARTLTERPGSYRRLHRALDDAIETAMQAARASYRLAVPVYDPSENRTKLLLPLCLVEDGQADCALVLDLQPSGAYLAGSVLSLPRAYACARVISREQPQWLAPERALE